MNIGKKLTVDAANKKDNHQILIAGSGAIKGSINANISVNNIEDKVYAEIDNTSTAKDIKAESIKISADEDINAAHIVVSGGGATNVALDVNPLVNTYNATVEAVIQDAKIKDAAVDMDASNQIDTLDVSAGVAGVAKGFAGVGVALKNEYTGSVKSYINNALINTAKDIDIDADAVINSVNWVVGGGAAAQGAALAVNVLLNDVTSVLEAGIKNSEIEKAGKITVNTNKDKADHLDNNTIAVGLVGQGLNAIVNVIKNNYANTVTSYVDNTSSTAIDSLNVTSNSDRRTDNINFGITLAAQGAGLAANALVNEINSTTRSYVDAKDKTLNVTSDLKVQSNDLTAARNSVLMGAGSFEGGNIGLNVNLYTADSLVKSEILSAAKGQINAGSVDMSSELTNALDNTQINMSLGLAALPIDVQIIEIGKPSGTYSQAETVSNVNKYVNSANSQIPQGLSTATTASDKLESGAISGINGNVKTVSDTNVYAKSQLRGLGKEQKDGKTVDKLTSRLDLNSYSLAGGAASIGVGVRDVQIANNTVA